MTNTPPSNSPDPAATKPLSPWRCLIGAVIAGALAYALYGMTSSIAHLFATKPIHADTLFIRRMAAAVRTLVVGMTAMGTGVFGLAAFGLAGLGIQLTIQRLKGDPAPPTDS